VLLGACVVVAAVLGDGPEQRMVAAAPPAVAQAAGEPPPSVNGSALTAPSPSSRTREPALAMAVHPEDAAAGIVRRTVVARGSGRLVVVRGRERAPRRGAVVKVRVEVERGLPVDGRTFARFVLRTLNDPRSWGARGRLSFARTDGDDADFRVVLASPATSAALCRPLDTRGQASCGHRGRAVLTMARWVRTTPEFTRIRTTYRQYVVNHEVGHLLGYSHRGCPRRGAVAPVMQQQTYGLKGCRPNPWPHP
jgi:hypothetical protein